MNAGVPPGFILTGLRDNNYFLQKKYPEFSKKLNKLFFYRSPPRDLLLPPDRPLA
jgi:hypothetical protein